MFVVAILYSCSPDPQPEPVVQEVPVESPYIHAGQLRNPAEWPARPKRTISIGHELECAGLVESHPDYPPRCPK